MRKRKWALFAFIFLIASIFLSLEGWRFLKANEKLKRYILTEFRPILGEQLHISKVHVSFGNIHIKGVDYPLPDRKSYVHIKNLRLGYNFFNLMIRGFDLQYISQDVLFEKPIFYLNARLDTLTLPDRGSKKPQVAVLPQLHLETQLKELDLFNHITVKQGEILYSENDSVAVTLVHSLQGGIFRNSRDSVFIHLDGAFLSSKEQNIKIIGRGSLKTNKLAILEASLDNYDLTGGLPFVDKDILETVNGKIDGRFIIKQNQKGDAYELSGEFALLDGVANLFDGQISLSEIYSDLKLEKGSLYVENATFRINDSPASFNGRVLNIREPNLDISIVADSLNFSELASAVSRDFDDKIEGASSVRLSITGPVDDIKVRGRIFSRDLKAMGASLQSVDARLQYYRKKLKISRCSVVLPDNILNFSGVVDYNSPQRAIEGALTADGEWRRLLKFLDVDSSVTMPMHFNAKVTGSLRDPLVLGALSLKTQSSFTDTLVLNAAVSFHDKQLMIESLQKKHALSLKSKVDWRRTPFVFNIKIDRMDDLVFSLWRLPQRQLIQNNFSTSLAVRGDMRRMVIRADIRKLADGLEDYSLFQANAKLERTGNRLKTKGGFILHPDSPMAMKGDFDFIANEEMLALRRFNLDDDLSASFTAKLVDQKSLSGEIIANSLDMARMFGVVDSSFAGFMNMKVSLLGAVDAPLVDGFINLKEVRYREIGAYDAFAYFNFDSTGFDLRQLLLNQGDATLLYASGMYNHLADSLNFSLKGAGFDAADFYGASDKSNSLVSGKTFVDIQVSGRPNSPRIDGMLAVKDGKISRFPFDEMELKLGDSTERNSARSPSRLVINKFRLSRFNAYEILGSGYVPFTGADSLCLDVDGKGNFLLLLNDFSAYFQNPRSECRFAGKVRGTLAQPRLHDAHLELRNASMGFRSVVPSISRVNGDLVLDVDKKFIRLDSLDGLMGGKPFHIYNEPADQIVSAVPLQNIHIGDSDVHFGVFVLETPEGGVPLNFVGLMRPNDFAVLDLLGREPDEKFYFASVEQGYTLRGRINLNNGRIMYPFYEGRGASPKVKQFLENMQWDLFVSPAVNTRFVKNFPGAIDEIYVDLKLDEKYGGLDISGRIADESFRINGQVRATKGFLEYLDLTFRVDQVGIEFDRSSLIPVAYGRAKTTVTDSLGIPSNIYLTMQTVDNTMDRRSVDDIVKQEEGRARFNNIRFKLTSDNPNIGVSEAQIMASLGYSASNIQNSALEAIGYSADNLILRPLFRPVERGLEQKFGFDYVRFSSQLTRNIILFNLNDNLALNNRLALLQSTKIMVGKYLADRFFVQYTGQIESGVGYRYKEKDLGLHHTIGLEYQINPQLLVELEYDYDSLMLYNRDDKRIILRHWFPF